MYNSTQEFIVEGLPILLSELPAPLLGIFATYNAVHGYDSGTIPTGKDGLTIEVQNGYSFPDVGDMMLLGAACAGEVPGYVGDGVVKKQRGEACEAQHGVCVNVNALEHDSQTNVFAYVYAGLSAFQEALDCAAHIKEDNPGGKVVVLTCDCDIRVKSRVLDRYVEEGKITDYVVTGQCGGRGDMRAVLDALVNQGPTNTQAA